MNEPLRGGNGRASRELRWRDIDWEEQEVHLYSRKTKEDRDLLLNESIKHFQRWKAEWAYPDPEDEDYIFSSITGHVTTEEDRFQFLTSIGSSRVLPKRQIFNTMSIRIC